MGGRHCLESAKVIVWPIVMKVLLFLLLLCATAVCEPLSDSQLFDQVQQRTFQYFWEGAEPVSGLARERFHCDGIYPDQDREVVTSGGSGFGLMALLVGVERGFIPREQALERFERILGFLETCDRFHGAWPHWWQGGNGKVKPFGKKDDGGDLVESSFMAQGLLCVRQYFAQGSARERAVARRADQLWREIDFDWYRNGKNVLYWHWSPNYGWQMNFPVHGYNECLIMYVLAASSPTHPVAPEVYHEGWAEKGAIAYPHEALGVKLQLRYQGDAENGGPLFWAHYSYLGLDPRGLKDRYADYEQETRNQALVNYRWCVQNPKKYRGYGPDSWGLTSSYSTKGYAGHAPSLDNDLGVLAPTAALASFPYLPAEAAAAMRNWYENLGERAFGPYGFYDAFSIHENWFLPRYLAIDQGPIVVMMENHRSQLLWKLFMSCAEVQQGLKHLGFSSPYLK